MNNETPSKQGILFLDSQDASSFGPSSDRGNSRANATGGPNSWSQLSSDSESLASLVDDSFSSKHTLGNSTKELLERGVQTDRKPRPQRLAQYMKNFQVIKEETSPTLLKSPMVSKYKRIDEGRLSLDRLEFMGTRRNSHIDDKPSTTNHELHNDNHKAKKVKNVSLGTQFRRKSCHCTECGGMSKLEQKTQSIVKAPNRELLKVRHIRKMEQEKNVRKRSAYLNLPNVNKLILSMNEGISPRSTGEPFKRREAKSSTSVLSKVHPVLTKTLTKEFVPTRRGAETPLRTSRKGSLEPQMVSSGHSPNANPTHYVIKIFTPADTEKQLTEEREALRKEEDRVKSLIAAPVLAKKVPKKPKPQRQRRDSHLYREVPASPSHSHSSHPSQSEFGRMSPRAHTWREGQTFSSATRPKVVIKKYELAPNDQEEEYQDEIVMKKAVETLDMRTKKELWGKIGLASPKFKAIFGTKMEERLEEIGEFDDDGNLTIEIKQQEPPKTTTSKDHVKRVYNRQIPKFKIATGKHRLLTLTSGASDSTASANRTNSHPVITPGNIYGIQSPENGPILDEALASDRVKTESIQGLYSIYASPKLKRSFSKPICLNFQGLHSNSKTDLPSIGQNSSISSARGHKSTFSMKVGSPNFKPQETKINMLKGHMSPNTDRPRIMISKKVSIGLRKITQSTVGQKNVG